MPKLTRRGFIAATCAAGATRALPTLTTRLAPHLGGKRILTLVYDKSIGAMRAVERLVP